LISIRFALYDGSARFEFCAVNYQVFPLEKNSLKLAAGDSLYDGDLYGQTSSSSEWQRFGLFLRSFTD
jgi:hypothetical protein